MDLVDVCNFDVEEITNRVLSITYSIGGAYDEKSLKSVA